MPDAREHDCTVYLPGVVVHADKDTKGAWARFEYHRPGQSPTAVGKTGTLFPIFCAYFDLVADMAGTAPAPEPLPPATVPSKYLQKGW